MKSIYLLLVLIVSICVVFAQESITVPEATVTTPEATVATTVAETPVAETPVAETPVAETPVVTPPVATTEPAVVPTTTTTTAPATTSVVAAAGDCLSADTFSTTDFFPNKLGALDSSAQFSVTYSNTYKLVHNLALDEYYVLYCTKAQPDVGNTFQSKTFIQIPVRSFAAIDTRALGYLDLLGQSNNIAYVGNVSNVTSPCSNKAPVLFDVNNANLDRTLYDVAIYPGSANNDPKGVGLGVNYAASPLGNAQWVKYFSLFTNQEVQAETIYNDIATDYNTFKNSINEAGHISYRRNVTFMNYDPSSTRFNILQDQYFRNLTSDAGANLITPNVLQPADPSVMKGQLQNASLVIDLTAATAFQTSFSNWQNWLGYSDSAIASATETALTNYKSSKKYVNSYDAPPFARNKQLWRLDLVSNQGSLDYWTRGMARPDLVLQDLIQAQFPDYFKSRNRVFLRDFDDEEATRTASSSDDYGCNLNNWAKAESVSYTNSAADAPDLDGTKSKLSLGVIIGVSVAGGMVALSCLVTAMILLIRKFKHNGSSKFTRLNDETHHDFNSGALDRDPMMMEETNEASGGRLGGSGRGL
ncbi:hypothetical protein INT48_007638 [Thamnidium elegans]|uniref:Uncharacterized protein n=1 Tax=Thamnidium elegans TaxID=101142 RepID=A0A8H7SS89_9FUNG|nr:hypothetical protein INT48_007638 [Thamnidium elegans]